MKFELVGKTRAKLCKVENQSKKMGQKELLPAIKIRVMATVPNTVLEMFDPSLRTFLYEKNGQGAKVQKQLEGIEVITDLPQLRQAGAKLGALHWTDEMTGCRLSIDHGLGGPSNITIGDCKVDNFKLVPKDGGTTQVFFTVFSTDVDRDSLGDLGLLHQHDVEIELTAPQASAQQSIPLGDSDGDSTGSEAKKNPFPVDGDTAGPGAAEQSPFLTPEQALSNAIGGDASATVVTKRRSRLAAVAGAGATE